MAAAFGSLGTVLTYGSRTNSTLAKPSGVSNGDTLLAFVFVGRSGSYLTASAASTGFTSVGTAPQEQGWGFYGTYSCFKKVITDAGSEPSDYTFTHASASSAGYIIRVSGSNGTVNAFSTRAEKPANTTRTWNSITPNVDGCYIAAAGFDWADTANNLSPPSGYTERVDGEVIYYCDLVQTTAGATGNISHTCNSSNDGQSVRGGWLVALEPASGGGSQSITGALFTNSNTFYGATVAPGPVSITGALFSNSQTFYTATISAQYSITGARFDNANSFFAANVTPGPVAIAGTLYSDPDSFFGASVLPGPVTVDGGFFANQNSFFGATVSASYTIQGALFTDGDTFYTATVTPGAVTISGALFSNVNAFYGATVSQGAGPQTITGGLFTNVPEFYGASIEPGPVDITGELFTNDNEFFSAVVSLQGGPQTVLGQRFDNASQFFSAVVSPGAVTIAGALFTDADGFYSATIHASYSVSGSLFENQNQFFGATVTVGPGPVQTINGSLYANDNLFFSATVFVESLIPPPDMRIARPAGHNRTAIAEANRTAVAVGSPRTAVA